MAILNRNKDPVVPMRPEAATDFIEQEIAQLARAQRPLGGSRNMERAKELITSGLTAAYKDGATALEHAIDEAQAERDKLQAAIERMDEQMDKLKRDTAEHILHLKSRCSEITAGVEARLVHLGEMLSWLENQQQALQHPPQPAPAAALLETKPAEE